MKLFRLANVQRLPGLPCSFLCSIPIAALNQEIITLFSSFFTNTIVRKQFLFFFFSHSLLHIDDLGGQVLLLRGTLITF